MSNALLDSYLWNIQSWKNNDLTTALTQFYALKRHSDMMSSTKSIKCTRAYTKYQEVLINLMKLRIAYVQDHMFRLSGVDVTPEDAAMLADLLVKDLVID